MVTGNEEKESFRPYAAPSNIIAVIQRARSRNLPESINSDFLRIAGITETVHSRVIQTLLFLDLINEDGRPTEKFKELAGATEAQYRVLLEKIVKESYREEFSVIDPGQDTQDRIIDAFRPYTPRSQTTRMVILFLGLCREAGIPILNAPRERKIQEGRQRTSVNKSSRKTEHDKQEGSLSTIGGESSTGYSNILFGVTEEDIAVLNEEDFKEVWDALGKVARARAFSKSKKNSIISGQEEEIDKQ
jgi:hypothetical protein